MTVRAIWTVAEEMVPSMALLKASWRVLAAIRLEIALSDGSPAHQDHGCGQSRWGSAPLPVMALVMESAMVHSRSTPWPRCARLLRRIRPCSLHRVVEG